MCRSQFFGEIDRIFIQLSTKILFPLIFVYNLHTKSCYNLHAHRIPKTTHFLISIVWRQLYPHLSAHHYRKSFSSVHQHINPNIHKNYAQKIVDYYDKPALPDFTAFCRCWRSKRFPYCDGGHHDYNKMIGDNAGPIIIRRRKLERLLNIS